MPTTLGSYLNPVNKSQRPAPRPQRTTDILGRPARGRTEGLLDQIMSHPAGQAFMLQTVASLLGQQGVFPSLGQGVGAMGRAASSEAVAAQQRQAQALAAAARAPRGGGGGGEATGGEQEAFNKIWKYYYELLLDADLEPEEAEQRATEQALAEVGMTDAIATLASFSPDDVEGRSAFLRQLRTGPSGWEALKRGIGEMTQGKARQQSDPPRPPSEVTTTPIPALSTTPVAVPKINPDALTPSALPGGVATPTFSSQRGTTQGPGPEELQSTAKLAYDAAVAAIPNPTPEQKRNIANMVGYTGPLN